MGDCKYHFARAGLAIGAFALFVRLGFDAQLPDFAAGFCMGVGASLCLVCLVYITWQKIKNNKK